MYKYPTLRIKKLDEDGLSKGGGYHVREEEGSIEYKNLVRSKNQMARLVMCNYSIFKTFITLTFEENLKDIKKSYSIFNDWASNIKKRAKSDFSYIAVPEFQKRGAIHYHLLTNIDYTDFKLLCKDEVRLWSPTSKSWQVGRSVVSWKKGYSLAKDITSENYDIIGYMSKYMLKDFDNRLFGHRRYLSSRNLEKPKEKFLDLNNSKDIEEYEKILYNSHIRYENIYCDKITNSSINFVELVTSHNQY